jgi:hypothetical protein
MSDGAPPTNPQGATPRLSDLTQAVDPSLRSDKDDEFLAFYQDVLGPLRDGPLNILEVGVFRGGSTLLLASFFPNARILGVDIREPPGLFFAELDRLGLADRVSISMVSQADGPALWAAIESAFGAEQLDLVIDDASHMYRETRSTFQIVFGDRLKEGGLYAIEDWGCGYWPGWPDGHLDGRHGLPRLVKELIDLVALRDRTKDVEGGRSLPVAEELASPISRAIITNGIAVFVRSGAPMPEDLVPGTLRLRLDRRVLARETAKAVAAARSKVSRVVKRGPPG